MMDKEKMMSLMMDMCCKGMSAEDRTKTKERLETCFRNMAGMMPQMKDMCKGMPEAFRTCCEKMDFSSCTKGCSAGSAQDKS